MDRLLVDLGLERRARRGLLERMRAAYAAEFRADTKLARQLGDRYRHERRELEALLEGGGAAALALGPALPVLGRRSEQLAPVVAELRAGAESGWLSRSLAELSASYLHMHANRLLRSAQRAQELVLYDFLARLDESRAARASCRSG